ncbi:MAG: hypothetical protein PHP93_04465 [Kiritimatiellales bacterium]|nr:hypothetical protein [Kiritimatiellales bacterium]
MSQRFTLHARAKIKAAIPALTSRIRKSVLFETAYYSSEGIRAVIAILIVLILGAVVYGSVGDYLMIRFKWYVYVRLFFAIPILGVFLFGLIAEPIFKLLGIFFDYLLASLLFLPRSIYWSAAIIADKLRSLPDNSSGPELIGVMLSVVGVILLSF